MGGLLCYVYWARAEDLRQNCRLPPAPPPSPPLLKSPGASKHPEANHIASFFWDFNPDFAPLSAGFALERMGLISRFRAVLVVRVGLLQQLHPRSQDHQADRSGTGEY